MLSVQTAWIEALTLMGVGEPYPALEVVKHNHPMLLSGGIAAQAVRYEDGSEALFISERVTGRTDILQHEAAHFAAWREHGEGIRAHGPEWRAHCRKRATKHKACKPTDFGRIN